MEIGKAAQALRNGRRAEAVALYEDIAARASDDVAAHVQLGHLCNELGAPDRAAVHYSAALDAEPDNAQYLAFLAVAYQQQGRQEEAFPLFERAESIDAEVFEVLHGLGIYYLWRSDYRMARTYLDRALQRRPADAGVHTNLATTLSHLDEHDLALQHARRALKIDPSAPNAHYAVGGILTQLGRTDEAIRHFEQTIRQHKTFGGAYDLLARVKKFSDADRSFIERTERILERGMPARERFCVHYALGKMYDDCKQWDKAFAHFTQANLLKKKPFDLKEERKVFRQMQRVFTAGSLAGYRKMGDDADQPVFIVGMPRSGTTLMERMIASHPFGAAAGELDEMTHIAAAVAESAASKVYAAKMRRNLTPDNIRRYAERYLCVLRQGREDARRIVDKMPVNYRNLGLIAVLFPNATIIHAIRNPLDTCLSCYYQNFTSIRWANSFESIAAMYRLYRDTIAYWRSVLPEGKIVDVHYERLIDDPESECRRLLDACGLEWDDRSLDFHGDGGAVMTASLWQVRQPIYKSSTMRWTNYAPYLAELAEHLASYLQEDRERLAEHGIDLPSPPRSWFRRLRG
jgi:tetratricopeptide (TPR) repeat protein